ncbi:hypothetical protein EDD21DRAFT_425628 [Dissophora ornata]|nr:hypothetical protein EDD21DRAFT_425628 [Dissophora ornata]
MVEPGPLDLDISRFLPPSCPVLKVPVVRVYGANEAGQKTCLHIHQAYPYFYVPYEGPLEPSQLQIYIHQLGSSLNHAACITFNTPQDLRKSQYVAAITPVKGVPFYGYHVGYSCFLKIYLFNPDFESRIVDLMRSGAIMGTRFQPFESHIPFRLQFFIDFNLYGMGWLELEEALLRNELPTSVSDTRIWSPDNDPGRMSHCEIEMDSTVNRIVNRDRAPERRMHQSLEECFKSPSLTAQVPSMAGLWEDDAKRRAANNLPTQELPKTQIRDAVSIPWLNDDLNKRMVADLVQEIMMKSQTKTPTQGDFDNYEVDENPQVESFMTAYESVDFLSADEWRKATEGAGRKKGRPSSSPSYASKKTTNRQRISPCIPDVSDDPIVVDDDDAEDDMWDFSRKPKAASEQHSRSRPDVLQSQRPSLKLQYNYPEPASPDREYFLSNIDEMWSSPSPPLEKPSFFYSPPRPISPDLIPARDISETSPQTSHKTPAASLELAVSTPLRNPLPKTSLLPPSLLQHSMPLAYEYAPAPPTTQELLSSFSAVGLPNVVHQKPYFSKEADVPSKFKVFGGKEFRLQSHGIKDMPVFKSSLEVGKHLRLPGEGFYFWEPNQMPPSRAEIQIWLKEEEERAKASLRSAAEASTQKRREKISQIEGPTQKNPFGYKNSPTKVAASIAVEKDFMDVLSLEVHCHTRGALSPDPKIDPIQAVFYCWQTERDGLISNGWVPGKLAVGRVGFDIHVAENEGAMMNEVIEHVRKLDPDILAGYEVHNLSWGYLVDRYQTLFGLDMSKLLSRVQPQKAPVLSKSAMESRDSYNSKHHSGLKFIGRHLFNVWRLIRGEVALSNYGFCNVVFHVLQQRVPHYSHETLAKWWADGIALHQYRVVRYYLHKVQYTLQLIESQELVSRTSEFARVFGVDFYSVISRGSQYKVESMMVRLAKPENFIMISPSRAQVAEQRALEVIPMVMEPESGFYEDPVVVLDFQSLYPSVMIAYNICYSTCLGKLGGGTKLGVLNEYKVKDGILPLVQEHMHTAPNSVMYVSQDIRRGLLGRMLAEILDTRVMVKKAMKDYPDNKSLLKLLNSRQLSLKFIANVTYGYTSASYSGRMPGIEIADSIVLSARETLERSIRFVNENPKWNARVVYGDTDSMFVQLKGRTRQEAFEVGYDIAETVTRMNPRPVKLKFEKVYHPCFLVTKKRYVGSSYETPNQKEPIFDAKGIETIRRDGVPAVQKIMETCIKTMFRTQDLSQVKTYFVRQLGKILEGRVPVPDLMFGKEVRMGSYSEKGVPPPGAVVSARRMELDPRAEPQHGERVPYVVVYGDPGARLTDQVVEPKELLLNKDLRLNGEYYIRKHVIPSMERIFQLAGADVKSWYEEMPRLRRATPSTGIPSGAAGSAISVISYTSAQGVGISSGSGSGSTVGPSAATVVPTEVTSAKIAAQQRQQQPIQMGVQTDPLHVADAKTAADSPYTTNNGGNPYEAMSGSGSPRFKPRRRGGKGFVSVGPRIDRYYQSQLCTICGKMVMRQTPNKDLCADCTSEHGRIKSMIILQNRLSKAEKLFRTTVDVCSSCCRSAPGGVGVGQVAIDGCSSRSVTGNELVACESLECNVFWQRRRAQDSLLVTRHLTDRVVKELEDLDLSF